MNCYFLSDIPAHLKIDGEYKGVACKNLSYLNVDNTPLFEFLPLNQAYCSVYSTKNSKNLKIFNFYNDKLIYPIFTLKNCHPFKVLNQKTKTVSFETVSFLAGVEGFEPSECQSQNLMPYRLATPH